jgi:hypothetical protein
MGYTELDDGYRAPAWISLYNNLAHCKFCDAVYTKGAKYAKVRDISTGTNTPSFSFVRDCKENVCPCCEK